MKKLLQSILILGLIAVAIHSCRVRSIYGELDAQWQITSILYADGREVIPSNPRRYISFYRHTVQFTVPNESDRLIQYTGNLVYDEDAAKLTIEMPEWNPTLLYWGLDAPAPGTKTYTTVLSMENYTSGTLTLVTPNGTAIAMRKY